MIESASSNSIKKSLGYSKPRTNIFNEKKREKLIKKNRFKNAGLKESDQQSLLSNDFPRSHVSIEIGSTASLPPRWVDYYEESLEKLDSLDQIMRDTAKLINNRVKKQFGNHSDLDAQINQKASEATAILHECEETYKRIREIGSNDSELTADKRTRENVERNLAMRIQEATVAVRKQQKGLLIKLKEDEDVKIPRGDTSNMSSDELVQEMEDLAQDRDEDINRLIDTINELSHLFKQMNQIVIEQGTLVDRIDYNVEKALVQTTKGKEKLREAVKHQSSKCGDYCIRALLGMNLVFSFMLVFKFAHSG